MGSIYEGSLFISCAESGELSRFKWYAPKNFDSCRYTSLIKFPVRLEPTLIELEREQEDLLIIGHASVIRCLLAYLIGLPASEIPAIEIARGDLLEVVPASYGVHSHAFHFWDGPGRTGDGDGDVNTDGRDPNNFYENYAESTKGKRKVAVEQWTAENVEPVGADEVEETKKAPNEQHVEPVGTATVVASADAPTITLNGQI